MRNRVFASATFVVATALLAFAGSAGSADPPAPAKVAVPDELIVGFEPGVSDAQASAAVLSAGGKEKQRFKPIKARLVKVEAGKAEAAKKKLANVPASHRSRPLHDRVLSKARSSRNQRSRSSQGTAALAGEVEGRTKSNVSPRRRS